MTAVAAAQPALTMVLANGDYTTTGNEWVVQELIGHTITLPTAPANNTRVLVSQTSGPGTTTISCGGDDEMRLDDGSLGTTFALSGAVAWALYQYNATRSSWEAIYGASATAIIDQIG